MSTTTLNSPETAAPSAGVAPGHPMDSSRMLLAMTALARRAAHVDTADDMGQIISRPVLKTLVSALQYRDVDLLAHSRRVAMLAVGMAQQLGWEDRSLRVLETAAILHDVGKVGISDSVLKKPGKLSPDESEYISRHHRIASNLLQAFRVDPEVIRIVGQSHAYFNGSLDGSARIGSEMSLGARILAVADAYDSLTNDQAFRAAKTHDDAMEILLDGAGSRFDGNVVAALGRWSKAEGLGFIMSGADVSISVRDSAPVTEKAAAEAGMLCHIFSYLNVLETLYDGFYVLDSDMKFVIWSAGAEQLVGRAANEMLGQAYSRSLLSQGDATGRPLDDAECPVRQVSSTGKAACREVKIQHADGTSRPVELQSIPLFDQQGKLQGVAQIIQDLSTDKPSGRQYRELRAQASRDPLTGVANRGELESQVAKLVEDFRAAGSNPSAEHRFSVIFADIDHFKALNDTYGHGFGDRVLIDFANALDAETFNGEFIARYGGEEFVIVAPERSHDEAFSLADRLRQVVSRLRFPHEPSVTITCSFGVAELRDADTVETLFNRADEALFLAKRGGRNRVETSSGTVKEVAKSSKKVYEFNQHFEACTQSDMIVYKLSGFVDEMKANLKTVSESQVVMTIGKAGWFGTWGDEFDEQPVKATVRIGSMREGRGAAKYVPIEVNIVPMGRNPKHEVFEYRAKKVVEALRSYLVAR